MNERPKVLLSWSSGKDSAWALHVLRQRGVELTNLRLGFMSALASQGLDQRVIDELVGQQSEEHWGRHPCLYLGVMDAVARGHVPMAAATT